MGQEKSFSAADEDLVRRSQQGDREAFEELVRRNSRALYARIYLETGDSHRTEDLVQETFLRAFSSITQLSDAAGFRAWLGRISHTVVIDAARRNASKKRFGKMESAALDRIAGKTMTPQEAAEETEAREKVLAVLRSLPEDYREPLTLRYLGGADYETIGKQLGLTNGSLRGLLHRGLELLRCKLGVPALAAHASKAEHEKEMSHETD